MSTAKNNILLLDIDHTTFFNEIPRPYLKEFIERTLPTHNIHFYTASSLWRVRDVCQIMEAELSMCPTLVRQIYQYSLSSERCPLISHFSDTEGYTLVKCLQNAANYIGVPLSSITLLDDMPMHDHPNANQRIQAPGFWGQLDDTYLQTLAIIERDDVHPNSMTREATNWLTA